MRKTKEMYELEKEHFVTFEKCTNGRVIASNLAVEDINCEGSFALGMSCSTALLPKNEEDWLLWGYDMLHFQNSLY